MRGLGTPSLPDLEALSLEEVLAHAVAEHSRDELVLLCSFQKEESVLVDALLGLSPDARVVTIDTGVLFPETLATWKAFEDRYGLTVEVMDAGRPAWAQSAGEDPGGRDLGRPWTGPDDCCGPAKVAALEAALSGAAAWITGVRREQGPTRAGARKLEWDAKRGMAKYNPLADWTEKDLWRRIFERDLPYNVLHDQGYESIGCAPCTRPGTGREGRWAGTGKTECGLHV